jgi:hypothetical protein
VVLSPRAREARERVSFIPLTQERTRGFKNLLEKTQNVYRP